jgi:hypothetical protein
MWNPENQSLFRAGALGVLRSQGQVDGPEFMVDELIAAFKPDQQRTVAEELERFKAFASQIESRIEPLPLDRLEVRVVSAGQPRIQLGLSASAYEIDADGKYVSANPRTLAGSAAKMLNTLLGILATLPSATAATTSSVPKPATGGSGLTSFVEPAANQKTGSAFSPMMEQHDAESIERSIYDGKDTFRVRAGWFSKFGAAVYPEVLRRAGLLEWAEQLPVGQPQPFRYRIEVEVRYGKLKVVQIGAAL